MGGNVPYVTLSDSIHPNVTNSQCLASVVREVSSAERSWGRSLFVMRTPTWGRRPIYVKLHGSVLHAIFGVELLTATAPVWLRLSWFVACIARKVIPRVRPPVCCVQYTAPSRLIACNVHCTSGIPS